LSANVPVPWPSLPVHITAEFSFSLVESRSGARNPLDTMLYGRYRCSGCGPNDVFPNSKSTKCRYCRTLIPNIIPSCTSFVRFDDRPNLMSSQPQRAHILSWIPGIKLDSPRDAIDLRSLQRNLLGSLDQIYTRSRRSGFPRNSNHVNIFRRVCIPLFTRWSLSFAPIRTSLYTINTLA